MNTFNPVFKNMSNGQGHIYQQQDRRSIDNKKNNKKKVIQISINKGPSSVFQNKYNNISTSFKRSNENILIKNTEIKYQNIKEIYKKKQIELQALDSKNSASNGYINGFEYGNVYGFKPSNLINYKTNRNNNSSNCIYSNNNGNTSINSSYFPKNTLMTNDSMSKLHVTYTQRNYNESNIITTGTNLNSIPSQDRSFGSKKSNVMKIATNNIAMTKNKSAHILNSKNFSNCNTSNTSANITNRSGINIQNLLSRNQKFQFLNIKNLENNNLNKNLYNLNFSKEENLDYNNIPLKTEDLVQNIQPDKNTQLNMLEDIKKLQTKNKYVNHNKNRSEHVNQFENYLDKKIKKMTQTNSLETIQNDRSLSKGKNDKTNINVKNDKTNINVKHNKTISLAGAKQKYKELIKNKSIPVSMMMKNFKPENSKSHFENIGGNSKKRNLSSNSINKNDEKNSINKKDITVNRKTKNSIISLNINKLIHKNRDIPNIPNLKTLIENNCNKKNKYKDNNKIIEDITIKKFSNEKKSKNEIDHTNQANDLNQNKDADFDDINTIVKNLKFENIALNNQTIFSEDNFMQASFEDKFNMQFDKFMMPLFERKISLQNSNNKTKYLSTHKDKSLSTQDTSSKKTVTSSYKGNSTKKTISVSEDAVVEKINLFDTKLSKLN